MHPDVLSPSGRLFLRVCAYVVLGLILLLIGAAFWFSVVSARDNGQYAQADPGTRQWFRNQLSPKTGGNCCSEADGVYAEEDIRDGHYWTRFVARYNSDRGPHEVSIDWMQVPDDVVIHDPNRNGAPVVWWYFIDGAWGIRCYAPGGGV